jgi:hypothetical protein
VVNSEPGRRRRTIAFGVIAGLALLLALAFFSARPTSLLGVSGSALAYSVGGSGIGPGTEGSCRHVGGSAWACSRHDDQFSSTVSYHVTVDGLGCWNADRFGPPGEGSKKHLSGCVTILSYLFS